MPFVYALLATPAQGLRFFIAFFLAAIARSFAVMDGEVYHKPRGRFLILGKAAILHTFLPDAFCTLYPALMKCHQPSVATQVTQGVSDAGGIKF